jgi:hypothetical protein
MGCVCIALAYDFDILYLFLLKQALLRGGKGVKSIIPDMRTCSPTYWVITAIIFPIFAFFSILQAINLIYSTSKKNKLNYEFVEGDLQYNIVNVSTLLFFSIFAGISSSLLGLGGNIIMGPVLLELGVHPRVSN